MGVILAGGDGMRLLPLAHTFWPWLNWAALQLRKEMNEELLTDSRLGNKEIADWAERKRLARKRRPKCEWRQYP